MENIKSKSVSLLKFNTKGTNNPLSHGVKKPRTPKGGKPASSQEPCYRNIGNNVVGQQENITYLYNSNQMPKVELKQTPKLKAKPNRLLSSKSLSMLVPRGLFFKKSQSTSNANNDIVNQASHQHNGNQLQTAKSFPTYSLQQHARPLLEDHTNAMESAVYPLNRVNSVSMIGLPRQSTSGNLWSSSAHSMNKQEINSTLEDPNLSPIGGEKMEIDEAFSFYVEGGPATINSNPIKQQIKKAQLEEQPCNDEEANKKKNTKGKFKPFKGTTLALRDVKNSIGLRMKAKQNSQAFVKLTNELTTPPIKLYSPFNIYSPDNNNKTASKKESKSKRKLNLGQNSADCSMTDVDDKATPKNRVALQHKKHIALKANQFAFDSPTGRLRDTVKDVEQFQKCIEDISRAIQARDQNLLR